MSLNHQDITAIREVRDARVTELSATGVPLAKMGAELGISIDAVKRIRKRLCLAPRPIPFAARRRAQAIAAEALTLTGPYRLGDATRAHLPLVPVPACLHAAQPDDSRHGQQVTLMPCAGGAGEGAKTVTVPDGTLPDIIRYRDKLYVKACGTSYRNARLWPCFDELDAVAVA